MCGVFLCPKQKASLLKDAFFISDSEFFPGKSNLSFFPFFPVISVLFPMKHFSKKRQSLNQLSFLLLFSAGFFFQYFFPIFRPGIGMLPHSLTAVCLSFLYAGNRNISPCFRNQRKNRLPFPCKNFFPESGLSVFSEFTGIFSIVSRETFFFPCILKKADIKRCPNRLLLIQIFFRSDSFSYAEKIRTSFLRLCTAVLFSYILPCRSRNPKQSPAEFFLQNTFPGIRTDDFLRFYQHFFHCFT